MVLYSIIKIGINQKDIRGAVHEKGEEKFNYTVTIIYAV